MAYSESDTRANLIDPKIRELSGNNNDSKKNI